MSFRRVTKYVTNACTRSDALVKAAKSASGEGILSSTLPSQTRPVHMSSTSSQSRGLRLEGIQGPISVFPTLKESRRILENAAKEANAGFSQQGIQGGLPRASSSTRTLTDWEMEDTSCPQGVQGCIEEGDAGRCAYFSAWLENCRRYGLQDCDQQLQGIQSGRLTLAQVLAEQEALIAEISESYRKRAQALPQAEDESMQGVQGDLQLPEVNMPCPQGVQGDDCVRFKLWLENCHRFGIHECMHHLQGFQSGHLTLAQIFAEQDAIIRQVAERYRGKQK